MKTVFLLLCSPVVLGLACSKTEAAPKGGKAGGARKLEYPVEVATLATRKVRYTVTAPGSVEAFQQVQITARVAGVVDSVSFKEGQLVKKGDVLAAIESERYRVAVDQAKAVVAKADANEKQAEGELARRQGAVEARPGIIPGEELATFATGVATAKADLDSARQSLRVADLNLRDSYVRAPISGVVQTRTVQIGQYLQPGAILATLLQRDPLLLRFQVTEQDAPRIKPQMIANLKLAESAHSYQATITLVAEAADPTTRLVPVTAEIDDETHKYWLRPGAFCVVEVPVGDARPALVVPTLAVQPTESGNTVYVVEKGTAKAKAIALGMHTPEGGIEVTRGLAAGELLVVRGVDLLSDGAPVKVTKTTPIDAVPMGGDAPPAPSGAPPTAEPSSGQEPKGDAPPEGSGLAVDPAPSPSGRHPGGHKKSGGESP